MSKPDLGQKLTEQRLEALEKRVASVYGQASRELQQTVEGYFADFARRDEAQKALVDAGELSEKQYKQWRLNQIARGERFETLRDQLAERMTQANEVAVGYVNDATPGIYSLNRNYAAYTIEQTAGNVGFTLWDEQTVRRLVVENPELMPYYPPKKALKRGIDLAYGKQQITASVTSSILQGKGIKGMADDLQNRITTMNRASAIRTARTAVTGAQNAGRMDSYTAAQGMGIKLQKEWLATLDGKTRHSHAMLDGERVDNDKEFSNGCRFPGDPQGPPHEIYNCRCTLIAAVDGVDTSDAQRRARDPETGENVLIEDMTYREWAKNAVDKSGGLSSETFMVHVNTPREEIDRLLGAIDYETAKALVGAQEGFSYRAYQRDDGMSSWGHAMFADSTSSIEGGYGGSDPRWFSVSESQLTDINDLRDDILRARKRYLEDVDPDFYADLSDDEFFDAFNPSDIVMSAEAYDNEDMTPWLWEQVLEPKGIPGVKTQDGAIVYDNSIMVRNLPMEVYTKGEIEPDIVEEMVEAASSAKESAEMLEYLSFKNNVIEKYGVDSMWSQMTDAELDTLERLERIAYRGA